MAIRIRGSLERAVEEAAEGSTLLLLVFGWANNNDENKGLHLTVLVCVWFCNKNKQTETADGADGSCAATKNRNDGRKNSLVVSQSLTSGSCMLLHISVRTISLDVVTRN
jgi:hypothetical protein